MANGYNSFDLGNVLTTGENILTARQNREAQLQDLELRRQQQIRQAQELELRRAQEQRAANESNQRLQLNASAENRAQQTFTSEQRAQNTALVYQAASEVSVNPGSLSYYLPILQRAGVNIDPNEINKLTPTQIAQEANKIKTRLEPIINKYNKDAEKYGLTPIVLRNPQGEAGYYQVSDTGNLRKVGGEGYSPVGETGTIDTNSEIITYDKKTGLIGKSIPKTLAPSQEPSYLAKSVAAKKGAEKTTAAQFDLSKSEDNAKFMLNIIDSQLNDKAVKNITGLKSAIPEYLLKGTEAARALARDKQLHGNVFAQAVQNLKSGGSTGLGQLTELEGQKIEAAMGRLDRAQSYKDYSSALRELKSVVMTGLKRAREDAKRNPLSPNSNTGTKKIVGSKVIPKGTPNYPNGGTIVQFEDGSFEVR